MGQTTENYKTFQCLWEFKKKVSVHTSHAFDIIRMNGLIRTPDGTLLNSDYLHSGSVRI